MYILNTIIFGAISYAVWKQYDTIKDYALKTTRKTLIYVAKKYVFIENKYNQIIRSLTSNDNMYLAIVYSGNGMFFKENERFYHESEDTLIDFINLRMKDRDNVMSFLCDKQDEIRETRITRIFYRDEMWRKNTDETMQFNKITNVKFAEPTDSLIFSCDMTYGNTENEISLKAFEINNETLNFIVRDNILFAIPFLDFIKLHIFPERKTGQLETTMIDKDFRFIDLKEDQILKIKKNEYEIITN